MSGPLVVLLHLCDSLFPIGSFAHSDGLETATSSGSIQDADGLDAWMGTVIAVSLETCDGPAVRSAWSAFGRRDLPALDCVDAELYALRPSSAGRESGRAMGTRLLKTWQQIRPECDLGVVIGGRTAFMLPTAFGIVAAASGVGVRETVEAFMYTRLAATVSAAMRLMPLGQHEGHALLARRLDAVPAAATRVLERATQPSSFAPVMDLAMMSQQYGHSRLFRS